MEENRVLREQIATAECVSAMTNVVDLPRVLVHPF
jgi:hypothetical protein